MENISKENYLKVIFNREEENKKPVPTSYLAEKLNVSRSAISDMAKRLSEEEYVKYEKYHGIQLLPRGRELAVEIVRKHRLWELFLVKALNMRICEVHDEAELLEHMTSAKLIDKIDSYLGHPKFDPHGDPIPTKKGKLPKLKNMISLSESDENRKYVVARITDTQKDAIYFLRKLGIILGEVIAIEKVLPDNGGVLIKKGKTLHSLSNNLADGVFVTPLKEGI